MCCNNDTFVLQTRVVSQMSGWDKTNHDNEEWSHISDIYLDFLIIDTYDHYAGKASVSC